MRRGALWPFKRELLFGRFYKNFSWPPFALFQKMRVLGDLAKITITWPFGYSWSRFFRQNPCQSLHFKCVLIRDYYHLCESGFGHFMAIFSRSPKTCIFSEKVQRGDQGKFVINRPKRNPRLKVQKALLRKWHYPLISIHL